VHFYFRLRVAVGLTDVGSNVLLNTATPTARGKRVDSGTTWEAIAGFSRAVRNGQNIHVSGTTATHSDGSAVGVGDAAVQTTYAIDKAIASVVALGGKVEDVVRTRL
jgi:enamine deaminase RidA (YjgF/YER057c/UK114 family)